MIPGLVGLGVLLIGVLLLDRIAVRTVQPAQRPLRPFLPPDTEGKTPTPESLRIGVEVEGAGDFAEAGMPELDGWSFRGDLADDPTAPQLLAVHGWGANRSVFAPLIAPLLPHLSVLHLIDVRSHGDSERTFPVTVRHFRDDVRRAIRVLRAARPEAPLLGLGHSMGGAALVLAGVEDGGLDGLVVVATPFDVYDAIARYLVERRLPGHALVPVLRPFWRRHVGVDPETVHPGRRAPAFERPARVIQPWQDVRVPPEAGEALARALGGDLIRIEGAGHSDVLSRPETARATVEFVRRFLR